MSLAKYLAKLAAEHPTALKVGAGAAGLGAAGLVAEPYVKDYAANAALDAIGDQIKQGVEDSREFAEKHPLITGAALGGSNILGGIIGGSGANDEASSGAPMHSMTQNLNFHQNTGRRRRR